MQHAKSFEILYTKDAAHKKRKVYHDGYLKIEENVRGSTTFKVILLSDDNKVLFQQNITNKDLSMYVSDCEVKVGAYQVQIEKENSLSPSTSQIAPQSGASKEQAILTRPQVLSLSKSSVSFKPQAVHSQKNSSALVSASLPFTAPSTCTSKSMNQSLKQSSSPQIDPQLLRVMHPHQVVAVKFLLNRLTNSFPSTTPTPDTARSSSTATATIDHDLDYILDSDEDISSSSSSDDDDDESLLNPKSLTLSAQQPEHKRRKVAPTSTRSPRMVTNAGPEYKDCRGAILADEMGLGKSLVSIAVLWHFVNHGKAKGIIVCPSSLVDNWHKELKKWLGVKLNAIRVRSGAQASADVQTFVVGHRSMSPVLIISYELFRKHADTLNKVPKLEVVICDEGHRLKNVTGTQTTRALRACVAKKRIVLTGSPIQNNLDELYAILQFVAPDNELGSLSHFKARLARHQECLSMSAPSSSISSNPAQDPLVTRVLGSLMLRRTQDEVLKHLLPPRTEVMLYMRLSAQQERQYQVDSRRILDSLLHSSGGSGSGSGSSSEIILPGLQRLRQICNVALTEDAFRAPLSNQERQQQRDEEEVEEKEGGGFDYNLQESAGRTTCSRGRGSGIMFSHRSRCNVGSGATSAQKLSVDEVLQSSSKLQVLDAMLQAIYDERQTLSCPPIGKVVIVSNFTSMLDYISQLLDSRGWGGQHSRKNSDKDINPGAGTQVLRLDGSVSCELRQGLVERFNRASDPSWIFLLAAKAGGVGLNLIGANRLVMMDCDWNPSIDLQAMARVWRQGQRLPVTIFRFVSSGTIEQSIIERQLKKGALCSVLDCLNPPSCSTGLDVGIEGVSSGSSGSGSSMKSESEEGEEAVAAMDQLLVYQKGGGQGSELQQLIAPTPAMLHHLPVAEGGTETESETVKVTRCRDPLLQQLRGLTQQEYFLGMKDVS